MELYENTLLSKNVVLLYNYVDTKNNVDEFMKRIEINFYRCSDIQPPKITQNYELKYEKFLNNKIDKVGDYVANKLDLIQEVDNTYQKLVDLMPKFTQEERVFFLENYLNKKPDSYICEKLSMSTSSLDIIKRSCIIKTALWFGKEVEI